MGTIQTARRFFFGTATPAGVRSMAEALYDPNGDWRVYLLMGGPGSGKSTLLRRVAANAGEEAEIFFCSGDPDSLDGVRIPSRRLLAIDATAPHAVQPHCLGVCEQLVPLATCADEQRLLSQRGNCAQVMQQHRELQLRCRRCLASAAALLADNARCAREGLDEEAVHITAARLAAREWEKRSQPGREDRCFLSAITPDGFCMLFGTVQALCPRIVVICDDGGAVAPLLLQLLKTTAVADGQTVLTGVSPLFPDSRIEQLLLPEIGTAFILADALHTVDFPVYRRIYAERFLDEEVLREHKNQLLFRRRGAQELIAGAAQALSQARELHRELERTVGEATNWAAVDAMTAAFLENIS